jgi:hypothetical protein
MAAILPLYWKAIPWMEKEVNELARDNDRRVPEYEAPEVVTYHEDDILERLGPAQACTPDPCPVP